MNFGKAVEAIKRGQSVRRKGWNGKGMSIYLNKGNFDYNQAEEVDLSDEDKEATIEQNIKDGTLNTIDGIHISLFERGDIGTVTRIPNINMTTATGSTVTGWLASQTDILAEDWEIVEVPYPKNSPRRICFGKMSDAELSVSEAIQDVEKMGADVKLTNAVVKLSEAREMIADFIDGK